MKKLNSPNYMAEAEKMQRLIRRIKEDTVPQEEWKTAQIERMHNLAIAFLKMARTTSSSKSSLE